jgi:hypothetical protein
MTAENRTSAASRQILERRENTPFRPKRVSASLASEARIPPIERSEKVPQARTSGARISSEVVAGRSRRRIGKSEEEDTRVRIACAETGESSEILQAP